MPHRRPAVQHRIIAIRRMENGKRIQEVRCADPTGRNTEVWTVDDAVDGIAAGTDEFLVASTVWSPVKVCHRKKRKYLRSVRDSCDHSNIEHVPEY